MTEEYPQLEGEDYYDYLCRTHAAREAALHAKFERVHEAAVAGAKEVAAAFNALNQPTRRGCVKALADDDLLTLRLIAAALTKSTRSDLVRAISGAQLGNGRAVVDAMNVDSPPWDSIARAVYDVLAVLTEHDEDGTCRCWPGGCVADMERP